MIQNCVTSNNGQTIECTSTGNGYDGAIYKLIFHIETVQYDKYATAWGTEVEIATEKPLPASEYLATNATNPANTGYNDTGADKGKMFQFTHILNEGTETETTITESRYIGDEPNNYVYFNCDDITNQSASTCEVWRIIGVFDVERPDPEHQDQTITEKRIKLVRASAFLNKMNWNNGSSNNDWTDVNASLKNFLNGDYYNRMGAAETYGLKVSAKNLIDDAVYYLGARAYDSITHYGSTEEIYEWERGIITCGACNSDITKLTWTGKIALMYPSDEYMVYGNGVNLICYDDPNICVGGHAQTGWIFNSNKLEGNSSVSNTWLLSSRSDYPNSALSVYNNAGLSSDGCSYYSNAVRPVVYLKSNVIIADGTGEVGKPYVLELMQ